MEGRGSSQFWKMTIRLEDDHVIWLGIFGFLGHLREWSEYSVLMEEVGRGG